MLACKVLIDSYVCITTDSEWEKVNSFCNYGRNNYHLVFSLHSLLIHVAKCAESKKNGKI